MYKKSSVYSAACIGMAFFGIAFIVMGTLLPSLTEKHGLDEVGASSLVTFLPIGILLGSLVFGPIADRFGYKSMLIVSTLFTACGLLGLSHSEGLPLLRFCIFLTGLGGGILNGATNALVAGIYDDRQRGSKLSFLGVFYGLGALGIPLLLGTLSKFYSHSLILDATAVFMLGCVLVFSLIRFPKPLQSEGIPWKKTLTMMKQPLLLLLGFSLFFQSGMEGLFNNWTTSYLGKTTDIHPDKILLVLTFLILGMVVTRLLLTYLLMKIKTFQVLFTGVVLVATGCTLLYFSTSFSLAAFAMYLIGSGLTGVFPIILSLIGSTYKEFSGTAIGFALFIALSGNSILNFLMGFVSKTFGISVFPLFIILNLISQAIIFYVLFKNKIAQSKT